MMTEQQIKDGITTLTPEAIAMLRETMETYYRICMEAYQDLYSKYAMAGWKCTDKMQDMITAMNLSTQENYDTVDKMVDDMLHNPEALAQMTAGMLHFVKKENSDD